MQEKESKDDETPALSIQVDEEEEDHDLSKREAESKTQVELSVDEQKKMNAAKKEVNERSFQIVENLASIIDDKIFEVERFVGKIEVLVGWIRKDAKPQADFTQEESKDIENFIDQRNSRVLQIRDESQAQRSKISESQSLYQNAIENFELAQKANNLKVARKVADLAKKLASNMKYIEKTLETNIQIVERVWEEMVDKKEELEEFLKPIERGMKNNIARIKNEIIKNMDENQKINSEIYLYYDENLARFFLYNHKPAQIRAVKLSPRLAYILGFEIDSISNEVKRMRMRHGGGFAKYTPDISSGIHQLYVYSPGLIEPSFVGNTQAPLLRIINVDKPPNTVAESIYTNMYFMKITEKRISDIKIVIKDSFNDILRFNWGNVIVSLTFRRSFI